MKYGILLVENLDKDLPKDKQRVYGGWDPTKREGVFNEYDSIDAAVAKLSEPDVIRLAAAKDYEFAKIVALNGDGHTTEKIYKLGWSEKDV